MALQRPAWIDTAKPVQNVDLDVGFLIADTFYYGPDHAGTPENWAQLRDPLYQPKIERHGRYVLSAAVGHRVGELVRYYRDVLRLMKKRQKIVGDDLYFWLRPVIRAGAALEFAFPWHDNWEDIDALFNALCTPDNGMLFDDKNEGWAFQAYGEGTRLHLWQSRTQSGVEDLVLATNRRPIAQEVSEAQSRMGPLLKELVTGVGTDHWTHR